ncbi:MAG: T9SS type A sorting domain-containing protein, partial [Calditrichota bacterium]
LSQIATIPGNSFSAIGFIAYGQGNIYATGIARHQIFQVDLATNERTVLAGSGVRGSQNGAAADASFNNPNGILFDKRDNSLYISDAQTASLRQITGVITGISVESEPGISETYHLGQNYPNPFNPATTIPFSLPNRQQVRIILYDMNGRLVQNLLNTTLPAGNHQLNFNLQQLASGVYTYRIIAGEFQQVKRMILQK